MSRYLAAVVPGLLWTLASLPGAPALLAAHDFAHSRCGFVVQVPDRWRAFEGEKDVAVALEGDPPAVIWIGPVWNESAPAGTPEAAAASAGAAFCLDCLRQDLLWFDRFTFAEGTAAASYAVYRTDLSTTDGRVIGRNGYRLQFFIVEDGTARSLGAQGWTRARAQAWLPPDRYAELEPQVLATVRSLRLLPPTAAAEACAQ